MTIQLAIPMTSYNPATTVVYIGTLHTTHFSLAMEALNAGKHVVVEKPMCMTALQSATLIETARRAKLFLMEAMWTRFFPVVTHVRKVLDEESLGPVHGVKADFCYNMAVDPDSRNYCLEKGGGAASDIGVYTTQWATFAFGASVPNKIACSGQLAETGVDIEGSMSLTWAARLFCNGCLHWDSALPRVITSEPRTLPPNFLLK